MCCAPPPCPGRGGWLRWESIKGMHRDRGGRLLSLVFILTQRKVKKAACDRREDWCAEYPPPPFPLPYLTVRDSTERAEIDSLPTQRYRACFSHRVIWDFQRRSGGCGGDVEGRRAGGYCAGEVGLVLVEMTGWWCGDRQGWLELREKWKTETEMEKQRPSLWDWRDRTAASFQAAARPETPLRPPGVASGWLVHRRIDQLSPNADWY